MGVLKSFLTSLTVVLIALWIPLLPPYEDFEVITLAPTKDVEELVKQPKTLELSRMERLLEGEILGPEGLAQSPTDPKVFYTSLQDGSIIQIKGGKMLTLARPSGSGEEECRGRYWNVYKCGRPLGIRFDREGFLIAADAYFGIFKIDVQSGEKFNLVSKDEFVDGQKTKSFNSVAPSKSGKIYYTSSSTNYDFHEGIGELLNRASGRLLVYDPITNQSKVLQSGLHATNGIVASLDEDYVVFAETFRFRLLKHWLKGPKAGITEVFLEGLPGSPDNLGLTSSENILMSLVTIHESGQFNPVTFVHNHPWLRKITLRMFHFVMAGIHLTSSIFDMTFTKKLSFNLMNFEPLQNLLIPNRSFTSHIVELDWNGKVVNWWKTRSSSIEKYPFFSEAQIMDGYIYLGSPFNQYVGRLKMKS